MDPAKGTAGLPGYGPKVTQTSRDFFRSHDGVRKRGLHLHSGTVDAGSSPTTMLRGGLVLVRVETGTHKGKFVHPGHADAPIALGMARISPRTPASPAAGRADQDPSAPIVPGCQPARPGKQRHGAASTGPPRIGPRTVPGSPTNVIRTASKGHVGPKAGCANR